LPYNYAESNGPASSGQDMVPFATSLILAIRSYVTLSDTNESCL